MMRRSKRQTKTQTDSTEQPESITEQHKAQEQECAIQKTKESQQRELVDQAITQQNNFQFVPTNRELDSVVINLASQLEKASNSLDHCEKGRPKRMRKITEKAEQGLIAKQNKVKPNLKKPNDQTKSSNDSAAETNKGINQGNKGVAQKNLQLKNLESSMNGAQQDEQDMDIEDLETYDKSKFEKKQSIASQEENDSYEEENSEPISEEEDDEINNEEQDGDKNNESDECENDQQYENDDNKEELSVNNDNQNENKNEDEHKKLSLFDNLDESSIQNTSFKLNDQKQESINQNKIKTINQVKQPSKKRNSSKSTDKQLNYQTPKQIDEEINKSNKSSTTKMNSEEQQNNEENQALPAVLSQKKQQKSSVSKKQKSQNKDEANKLKENEEQSEEEGDQIEEEDFDDNKNDNEEEATNGEGANSKAKKMPWSEEEDKLVIRLVEQHGPQKWTFIAQHIPGRIGKQCRERWHNHLNPKINKEPWGDDEEWILFLCHKLKGNKWAEITQYIPGRTDNAIKNHWNSSMKKRIPELYKRFTIIKRGELIQYDISEQYKSFEDEILQQLLAISDEGVDQYFVQTTRRRKNNKETNTLTNTQDMALPSLKQQKSKKIKDNSEEKPAEDEQELIPPIPLTKKASKAAMKAAAKQINNEEFNSVANNHFTPCNNKSSYHSNVLKNIPNSAAASTADVKEIIQRIPQNIKEFENFRKQIILYSDEYYQQQHILQQTPNEKDSSLNIFSADKQIVTDINLSDSKHLEKILENPLTVENYVQQNPAFADIVRSALKYSSCQKNLNFASNVKNNLSENFTNMETSTAQQEKQPNLLDQSFDEEIQSPTKNGNDKMKKKRGRKPKASKDQDNHQNNQATNDSYDNTLNNESDHPQNENGIKKMFHGHHYMHPMYMMNPHHAHPYYSNHPHHLGYPPPPPHMMGHRQQSLQEYPHHMQHPIPPHHMQQSHYNRNGQMGHPHPHQNSRSGSSSQGYMMMPPPPPHHLQQMRMHPHHGMPRYHSMYIGGNNDMMNSHSQNNENPSFQTPQKYQKNNQGDRFFKSITPLIPQNSENQLKFDFKISNKLKINNFPNDDEFNNFLANTSFSKENIHPNVQHLSLPSGKDSSIPVRNDGNTKSNNTNDNSSNLNHGNGQISNLNNNFTTPNKYDTPSKLLDFDSEFRVNCNSVDKYFNMRAYSSYRKNSNLYANGLNTFQHSQNSAFKCYPNLNVDYQDTPSAKKLSYC